MKKTKHLLVYFLFSVIAFCAKAQNASWFQDASVGAVGRQGPAGFAIGHYGFIGGGYTNSGYDSAFYRYDQHTKAWTQIASYPGGAIYSPVKFVIGSKGYVGIGYQGGTFTNMLWAYDTVTNTWSRLADFPGSARYGAFSFSIVIGSKAYIGCGSPGGAPYYEDVWQYDAVANAWTQMNDFPAGERAGPYSFSIGNIGYVGGGSTGGYGVHNDFWQYNDANDTWQQLASLPTPSGLANAVSFVIGNSGFIGTGLARVGGYQQSFYKYNATTGTWSTILNLIGTGRWVAAGFSIGNIGYIGTGEDNDGNLLNDFWQYDTSCGPVVNIIPISDSVCSNPTGVLQATATGLYPPFTYSWLPGGETTQTATGLGVGTYTVTVTNNNGCSTTVSGTINRASVSVVTTKVSCYGGNNGTATATLSGGTAPYIYLWSSGGTNKTNSGLSLGTYSVTVTDNTGCSTTASANIAQPLPIHLSFSTLGPSTPCAGALFNIYSRVSGGSEPYTYLWMPGNQTGRDDYEVSAGTYSLTVTDNSSCTVMQTVTLTQAPLLAANATVISNVSCGGNTGSASVSASNGTPPYTYLWTPSNETNAVATGLSAGEYNVTVTDNSSCTALATVDITQSGLIGVSTSITTNITCYGQDNGSVSATPSSGTAPFTYSWSGGGTNSTNTGLSAGTYTVIVTDNHGCSNSASVTLPQPSLLSVVANITNNVSCSSGNTGSLSAIVSGGTSPYTYSWSGGGTNSTKTGLSAGTYSITVTDNNGCTATTSAVLSNFPITLSSSAPNPCQGSIVNLNASVSGGVSPYTYLWMPGTGLSNSHISNPSYAANANKTFTCKVTDHTGCSVTATIVENIDAISVSTTDPKICSGTTGSLTATVVSSFSPFTYSWNPSSQTNQTATGLSAGTFTITVTDNNGCSATNSNSITLYIAPTVSTANSSASVCYGDSASLNATVSGGALPYSYSWIPSTGLNCNTCKQPNASPVNKTYTVTVTDAHGCTGTASVSVVVDPILNLTITSNAANPCQGSIVNLSANITGGASPYTYSWSPATSLNSSTVYNPYYTATTNKTFTCKITDNFGCSAAGSITENIDNINANVPAGSKICSGTPTGILTANVTGSNTFPPYTYSWRPAGGTNQSGTGLSAGSYTVTVTDNNGCSATGSNVVNSFTPPTLSIAPSSSSICYGEDSATLTPTINGGALPYTYSWSPSTGLGCITCKKPNASPASTTTYTLTVTDNNGCTGTSSVTLNVNPLPTVSVVSSGSMCSNILTLTASGATTYIWTPSTGLNTTAGSSVTAGPTTNITYTVTGTDANGCTNTASISIGGNVGYIYTSVPGGGNWSNPATWTGGPAGTVPMYPDSAVIASPVTEDQPYCISKLTVNSGQTLTISTTASILNLYGKLVNNGTITGGTYIYFFRSNATVISGGGTYTGVSWWFEGNNQTIANSVHATLSRDIVLGTNEAGGPVSVKHSGSLILANNRIYNDGTYPTTWTNNTNATLTVGAASFTNANDALVASATNNTVNFEGTAAYNITQPVGNTFYNLGIAGNKSLTGTTLNVTGNITVIGTSDVLNVANNTINLTGNLVNNGTLLFTTGQLNIAGSFTNNNTLTAGTGTITFNGTGTQNFTSVNSSETFENLIITGTSNLVSNCIINVSATNTITGTMTVQ